MGRNLLGLAFSVQRPALRGGGATLGVRPPVRCKLNADSYITAFGGTFTAPRKY